MNAAILRWLLTGCLTLCAAVAVQNATAAQKPMVFDHLGIADGLSQGTATKILQDRNGFLWIATESGLNRYDGSSVQRYNYQRDAEGALAGDFIWDLHEDASGDLWIATKGAGVARLDQATGQFHHYRHDPENGNTLSSDAVRSLEIDQDGLIWIGTRDAGLNRLDPRTGDILHFSAPPPVVSIPATATIFDIKQARNGTLWVGTNAGLFSIDANRATTRQHPLARTRGTDDARKTVITIDETADGNIWAGTYESGLFAIEPTTDTQTHYLADKDDDRSLADNYVRDILEDKQSRLWVATAGGLSLLDRASNRFVTYKNNRQVSSSIGSSYVMTLYQDRGGILWLGTRGAGLASWDPRSWSMGLTQPDALADSIIVAFADDRDGHLWLGTMGAGLQRMDRSTGALTSADRLLGDAIADLRTMALLFDRSGRLWVGTMANGLRAIDLSTGAITAFKHDPEDPATLSHNGVMSLHQHSDGTIWVGTFGGGVNRIDPASGIVKRGDSLSMALAQTRVTAISEDQTGQLWIATDGDGLFAYRDGDRDARQFRTANEDPGTLSANRLYALHFDASSDRLWIGTAGRGLDVVSLADTTETPEFTNLSVTDGLSDNVIYGIQSDANEGLWLSSNNGLMRYDLSRGDVRTFHTRHGLQGEEFNFGAHHRSADGQLFFAGSNGINAFYPAQVIADPVTPGVVLTDVHVDNAPIASRTAVAGLDTIELTHNQRILTFEAAVPDFADPAQNTISYRLEGFDTQWSAPSRAMRFTYTNLDAGDYALSVRATNSAGVTTNTPLRITIRKLPAPWATWWAYLLYCLTSVALILLAMRVQRRRLQRLNEIARLSNSDPVTGLLNRDHIGREISRAIENTDHAQQDLAVLAIDFNHIKRINDSFGLKAGDSALKALGNRLLHTSVGDDLQMLEVARITGDEFAIVMAGSNCASRAQTLGARIATRFAEATLDGGLRMAMTTNVGIALYPVHGEDADTLLKNAQAAAHALGATGEGQCVVYSASIEARLQERVTLDQELRTAIERDEFRLYLQPKFDAQNRTLVGAEALIRWEHPQRGLVPPNDFIPVAEEIGMIEEIGNWVTHAAARRIREWLDNEQPAVPIAINLSAAEFRTSNPAHSLQAAADAAQIDVSMLHVELTESIAMQDAEQARNAMEQLRDIGCRLSIDDFGTGFSSLAYLRRFPLDTLKIDRAFINEITISEEDRSICAAIIAMAHGLNLSVVAEGVETEAQLEYLVSLGCDQIQGYYLGKPVPDEQFVARFGRDAHATSTTARQPYFELG